MTLRKPLLAGSWYPASADALRKAVESSFLSPAGPGSLPEPGAPATGAGRVIGIISPHAGLSFSGPVAAHGYHALASGGLPDVIVLVGSHGGFDGIVVQDAGKWESPLGASPVHETIARAVASSNGGFSSDPRDMRVMMDNTFELQLPFIHYLKGPAGIPLVPIAAGSRTWPAIERAAAALARVLSPYLAPGSTETIAIVGSTDLTHYGRFQFGFAPAHGQSSTDQNDWVRGNDARVLRMIQDLATVPTRDILEEAASHHNLCCPGAVALVLETVKQLATICKIQELGARVLKQATSYDVLPDRGGDFTAVGYASVAFRVNQ